MMRSAARRNEVANYRLEMVISGQGSSSSVGHSTQTPIPSSPSRSSTSSSEPPVYPTADGFELNIGYCYARFDTSGTLLQGGSMCDDIELSQARDAARDYVGQLHNSSSGPQIYTRPDGFELNIGDCYARFDTNGTLVEGGSMCDEIELFEAREAAENYVGR